QVRPARIRPDTSHRKARRARDPPDPTADRAGAAPCPGLETGNRPRPDPGRAVPHRRGAFDGAFCAAHVAAPPRRARGRSRAELRPGDGTRIQPGRRSVSDETRPPPLPSRSVIEEVIELRRHFHRHPEVSFSEHDTSTYLGDRLKELGLELKPCPTDTGVVAMLDTGRPGKTVMLRADIDALPIQEESGVDFASAMDGRMHACGHDAHMAMLVGVARTLVDRVWDVNGRYLFVFQPAEEIVSGAKAMIAGGLLDEHHPDAVLGLHITSFLESGTVVTKPGLLWAGSDAFDIGIA